MIKIGTNTIALQKGDREVVAEKLNSQEYFSLAKEVEAEAGKCQIYCFSDPSHMAYKSFIEAGKEQGSLRTFNRSAVGSFTGIRYIED